MFKWLRKKLGITALQDEISALRGQISSLPELDARHRQVLTAVESVMSTLKTPTPDDGLIMFHLRCMGYAGGWKVRDKIEDTVHKSMQDWEDKQQFSTRESGVKE